MKEGIKALAAAIEEKEAQFMACKDMDTDTLRRKYLHELDGLREAFRIITGETYIDWFIRQNDA